MAPSGCNPKVALFLLAILPQFIDASTGAALAHFLFLGVVFNLMGTAVSLLVACAGDRMRAVFEGSRRAAFIQRWLTGGVFVALGVRLALVERK